MSAACGDDGGNGSSSGVDAATTSDTGSGGADSGGGGDRVVNEVEPNNERDEATQFPAGGGTFTVHGTCADSSDGDYYDVHPETTGAYTATLTWQAGAFELSWDPEDGMTGSKTDSMTSPIMAAGQLTATTAQFNIDCYNANNPAGLAGLAYTVELTLP
jgi:hypothetical protein